MSEAITDLRECYLVGQLAINRRDGWSDHAEDRLRATIPRWMAALWLFRRVIRLQVYEGGGGLRTWAFGVVIGGLSSKWSIWPHEFQPAGVAESDGAGFAMEKRQQDGRSGRCWLDGGVAFV